MDTGQLGALGACALVTVGVAFKHVFENVQILPQHMVGNHALVTKKKRRGAKPGYLARLTEAGDNGASFRSAMLIVVLVLRDELACVIRLLLNTEAVIVTVRHSKKKNVIL